MKVEFSSDETINHFGTPWWDRFHKAVDDGTPRSMIVGADGEVGTFGIVMGLIGLDCPHTCPSELHPVWAMALQVGHDPADETWAVFVRRHGNEGFCSDHQHILDDLYNDTFTFRLPWRPGATAVAVHPSTTFESERGQASMALAVAANQGVLLSFTVPTPPPMVPNTPWLPEMVNGELHLTWTIQPGGLQPTVGGVFTGGGAAPPVFESREDDPDDRLNRLFAAMTPAQLLTITTKVPPPAVTRARVAMRTAPAKQIATLPVRTSRRGGPRTRAVEDAPKKALDQKRLDALHAVYGSEIPGFPRTGVRLTPRPPVVR